MSAGNWSSCGSNSFPFPMSKDKKGFLYNFFKKTKGFDRTEGSIPPIVSEPIAWLRARDALKEEGIFRIPGSATKIKELKKRYDKGKKVDLEEEDNVHTVSGLLKVFFRELPEPLLTFELYDAFIAATKPDDTKTRLEYIKSAVNTLPAGNRVILSTIISFLQEVSQAKGNCMNATNLAIVFAPNLIRPKVETIDLIITNSSYVNTLISILIQYYGHLFNNEPLPEEETGESPVFSPHLISLKQAQKNAKGDKSEGEQPLKKSRPSNKRSNSKKHDKDKTDTSPKKRPEKKDDFYSTLKVGTLRLATSLLEEADLDLELKDIDDLPEKERKQAEARVLRKLKTVKAQKKAHREGRQRIRSNTFKFQEVQEEMEKAKAEEAIAESPNTERARTKKMNRSMTTAEKEPEIDENRELSRSFSVSTLPPPLVNGQVVEKPTPSALPPPPAEYLEEYFQDDSVSFDDSSEEDEMIKQLEAMGEEAEVPEKVDTNIEAAEDTQQEMEDVAEGLLEGDVDKFHDYLDGMKSMKRMERKASRKLLMNRLSLKVDSPQVVSNQ